MESVPDVKPRFKQWLYTHWQGVIIMVLPIVFLIAMLINDSQPCRCFYVILAMFICWIIEIFPLPITAMFPIVAFPLMNILESDKACSFYFKQTLVMFVISMIISLAMEYTTLHNRLAVNIIKLLGLRPRRLHIFLVVITSIISMLIPNSVCMALMYPVTHAILDRLSSQGIFQLYLDDNTNAPKIKRRPSRIAICFYLSVAYASTIAGSANLMGSDANLEYASIYEAQYPLRHDLSFGNWLGYAAIPMILCIVSMCMLMEFTHMGLFRPNSPDAMALNRSNEDIMAARQSADMNYAEIGSITMGECTTATLIVVMIVMIFTRQPAFADGWGAHLGGKELLNASIASVIIFLIFSLPAKIKFLKCWDASSVGKTPGLLTWKFANSTIPWGLIFVIGCAGTLAEGTRSSGLAKSLEDGLTSLKDLPTPISLFLAMILIFIFTNLTVNAAVISVFAPGIIQLAVEAKIHPLYFLFPVGLTGTMAFLMPSATAPNALVAAYANIKTKDMFLAGIGPSIASIIIIYIFAHSWAFVIYSDVNEFPVWAYPNITKPLVP